MTEGRRLRSLTPVEAPADAVRHAMLSTEELLARGYERWLGPLHAYDAAACGRLFVATSTVETHRRNIARKLGIHSVADLTKYAIREGMTSLER